MTYYRLTMGDDHAYMDLGMPEDTIRWSDDGQKWEGTQYQAAHAGCDTSRAAPLIASIVWPDEDAEAVGWEEIRDVDLPHLASAISDAIDEIESAMDDWAGCDWCAPSVQEVILQDDPHDEPRTYRAEIDSDGLDGDEDADELAEAAMPTPHYEGEYSSDDLAAIRAALSECATLAIDYARRCTDSATEARAHAMDAVTALRAGDIPAAAEAMAQAVAEESEWGDSPTYRPCLHSVESIARVQEA
jgi:hypothetical protein